MNKDDPTVSEGEGGSGAPAPVVLAGRYRVIALLGSGGMGSVYLARDLELDELVAVKLISSELAQHPKALERFRQEVRLARRVTHVNVARTFDIGEHEGIRFLTMEYIEGESLSAVLKREAPLSLASLLGIADDICAGLAAAHAAGVIHRDLKPHNVLIARRGGRAVITDFGVALSAAEDEPVDGSIVGTPSYMAPEQLVGATIDARADVFALGAILYWMATGRRPFPTGAGRRFDEPAPDPRLHGPSLPHELADVIVRCMAVDPNERIGSAEEVRAALTRTVAPTVRLEDRDAGSRRLVRDLREDVQRVVAIEPIATSGIDPSFGEGVRSALLDRLREQGALAPMRAEDVEGAPEAKLHGRLQAVGAELQLAITLESSDGFVVLAETFRGGKNDLLSLLEHAAIAVTRALVIRAEPAAFAAALPSQEAMELYFKARAEYQAFWPANIDRAVTLYERAALLAPEQPLILAGLAISRARKCFYVGSGLADAHLAAERALSVGDDRPAPHLAAAAVAMQANRAVDAVMALGRALSRAPGFPEAQGMLARVLGEIGAPFDAIGLAESALARAPDLHDVRPDLLRIHVLLGDTASARRVVESVENDPAAWRVVALLRMRFASWRRDVDEVRAIQSRFGVESTGTGISQALQEFLDVITTGKAPLSLQESEKFLPSDPTPRRLAFHYQIMAENCAYVGDRVATLEALERSAAAGLFDTFWLDRCPLFDPMRGGRRFEAVREVARSRALAALDALDIAEEPTMLQHVARISAA